MLGDIVGRPGRGVVTQQLPDLRKRLEADVVIANAENCAAGSGLTPELADEVFAAGVDGITLGDHAFRRGQIYPRLNRDGRLSRPANVSAQAPGKPYLMIERDGWPPLVVITVLGRLYMHTLPADDPFACVERLLGQLPADANVIVEVHAEATSEKVAMGWRFNGRVAAVLGTHTHIPTADHRILPVGVPGSHQGIAGTAYVSDLGMSGPIDSVLGRRVDRVLKHMTTAMPSPFDVADGPGVLSGVLINIDDRSGRATAIEPVRQAVVDGKLKPAW